MANRSEASINRRRQYSLEYSRMMKVSRRKYRLKHDYGISPEEYDILYKKQSGLCAICKRPERLLHNTSKVLCRLAVDHCHKTGVVRGLLCRDCNLGISKFEDDTLRLQSAINYLESTNA